MYSKATNKTLKNQKGIALLVMIIFLVLAFSSYYLSGLSINQVKIDNSKKTSLALKKAKDALLSYAVVRSEMSDPSPQSAVYGYLPCPSNTIGDGNSVGSCDSAGENTLGWFPWRSLRLSPIKDGNGDCLLYAVSSTYKFNPASDMLNQDSYGMFKVRDESGATVLGANSEDRVVAVVFSSGKALAGQSRVKDPNSECNNDPDNFDAYLDSFEVAPGDVIDNSDVDTTNANQIDEFIHKTVDSESASVPHNDRFVTISRDEIRDALFKHTGFVAKMENLTQALAMCLSDYANHTDNTSRRLPWPAMTNLGGAAYDVDASYQDDAGASNGYSGRFPFDVTDSNTAINGVLATGELFSMAACSSLVLTGSGAGVTVDLEDTLNPSEYRKLWNHWKDHFFYIVSKAYEPGNSGEVECGVNDCIEVTSVKQAGAVIFSGKRLDGVARSDKSVVGDYLEDGKSVVFNTEVTNKTGNESYTYTDPQTEIKNDIMYCINNKTVGNNLEVTECP